jgi:MFS family permease
LGTLATYRRVLGNSALTRLLAGEFVSSIGDWLYLVALLVVVYQRSNSAALLGVVGAARVLPYVLLSVPAGMLVDRFDRRMVLLVTDLARGTVMLGLAALVWFNASLVAIIALTLLAATFSTFFGPAIAAFLPSLARDESELGPANSAWASLDNLGFVIGPALAGVLIAVGGQVGAIGSGVLVLRRRLGPPLVAGGLVLALGLVFLGSSGSLLPALLAMAVASAGDLVMEVVATTLFQRVVPDEIRGRAYGIMHTITVSAYAAGSLLMPIAAGVTSMVVVLAGAGIAMAAAVVIGVLLVGTAAIGTATLDPVRATLLSVPVFSGLPPTRLVRAAQRAEVRSVEPDEVVIRQGDAADRFYVIADGEFIVTQRQPNLAEPVELRRMHAGEVFGEIGLLSGVPRTATVSAAASGTLLSLDGPEFLELVGSGPGLTSQLLDLQRGPAAASAS